MIEFNDLITYFMCHTLSLNVVTISTVLAKYGWDHLKTLCQEMEIFKLDSRRIIGRIVEGTSIDKNSLYSLYDSFVAPGVHNHIPVDLRPKRYNVRV